VRAPLMLLYVAAFCGGRLGEVHAWILLAVAAPAGVAVALIFERRLIRDLMVPTVPGALIGLGAAAVLYGAFAAALQAAAGLTLGDGMALTGGDLPFLFGQLLAIKTEAARLHPAVVGIVGAVALGAGEEVFWGGFVLTRMMLMMRHSLAVIVTAALFAGFYAVLLGPLAAAAAGALGLVAGAITVRTRTLVPAMIAHGLLWIFTMWLAPLI